MKESTEENETKPEGSWVSDFRYAAAYKNKANGTRALIVAPEMDQLREAWNRLTGGQLELNEDRVREVRILRGKLNQDGTEN